MAGDKPPEGVDIFDVDHTITRRSSGSRYVALAMRRGVLPRRLIFAIAWFSMTYHLGIIRLTARESALPYLRGLRRDALEELAQETFTRWLKADIFPGALDLVRRLHDEGRRVMIATSSIDFIVAPLAAYMGIDGVLATSLEFREGVCTGRIVGAPMFRGEKKNAVLAYLAENGIPPADCSFYSDSAYDLPLLESVGRPVAVNPDSRLRGIARARGWTVIDLA
jgi:HAD superfamily hydrolase (TIGR01490 family)